MIEQFPFHAVGDGLEDDDFILLATAYRSKITHVIPHSGDTFFLANTDPLPKVTSDPKLGSELSRRYLLMQDGSDSDPCILGQNILMPFTVSSEQRVVALITDVDPMVLEHVAVDWLRETRDKLHVDFCRCKTWYTDPATGLLNSTHLFDLLAGSGEEQPVALLLVNIPVLGGQPGDIYRFYRKIAHILLNHTNDCFSLHHLGSSLFALFVPEGEIRRVENFSARLSQILRRENLTKVHIGSSSGTVSVVTGNRLLDEAWTALHTASRRGPFAFCDYNFLASANMHPLRPVSLELADLYMKKAKRAKAFCILYFSEQYRKDAVDEVTRRGLLPDDVQVLGEDRGVIVFMGGVTGEETLQLGRQVIAGIGDSFEGGRGCCGVSCFPFEGFSRRDTLVNARKALLHAELLGEGNAVLFDAVSLNVSGDIYFGDGDLASAVNEYRRGVAVDETDVNIRNSLGVTYAMLNQHKLAQVAFERVLDQDADNTLALYNLGLGQQLKGNIDKAVAYYERARKSCHISDDSGVCQEVEMQLGCLYCRIGRYRESVDCLTAWLKEADKRQHARVFRYLGEAYLENGQTKEAMVWLQRAMRHNEYDHEALGLLGTATWRAQEGDDIALAFCRKSVDLAPESIANRLRLADLQMKIGQVDEALENLEACRGRKELLTEVQLAKARAFLSRGEKAKARSWAKRVLNRTRQKDGLHSQAQAVLKSTQE